MSEEEQEQKGTAPEIIISVASELAKRRYPGEPFLATDQTTYSGYIVRDGKILSPKNELTPADLAKVFYPGEPILATDIIAPDGTIIRDGKMLSRKKYK